MLTEHDFQLKIVVGKMRSKNGEKENWKNGKVGKWMVQKYGSEKIGRKMGREKKVKVRK